jgi:predicted transposase YbfD/YdcC
MNERIRELSKQAAEFIEENSVDWVQEEFEQKFAELIVRECADACYKHKDVESFGIYPVRVAMVTKACSDNIKEHFGVEE